jgi:hypothetical protein
MLWDIAFDEAQIASSVAKAMPVLVCMIETPPIDALPGLRSRLRCLSFRTDTRNVGEQKSNASRQAPVCHHTARG